MARPLRVQYPGAVYHVTCRGNERKDIYKDDVDRKTFLKILIDSSNIYAIKIYSYLLMSNHFHLLIDTPLGNLSEFMRHFNITYTSHFNRRYKRAGHLYQGRYKSILVDKDAYLSVLSRYIHLNPVRLKNMKAKTEKEKVHYLKSYRWSSLTGYINKREKHQFVDYSFILEEYGGDNEKGRKSYKERLFADLVNKFEIKEHIIGQSILGKESFIKWVKEKFLGYNKDRERPSMKKIHTYLSQDAIIKAVEQGVGKGIEEIRRDKGINRQIAMELLYRLGGLNGVAVGEIIGIGYTAVSQERRRLREKMKKNRKIEELVRRIEKICQ